MADATGNVKSEISTMNSHESIEDAFSHTRAGALTQAKLKQELPALTKREREVLRLLADGHSNEVIGKQLFISPETVRTHIRKAMEKLDADTRTQAVATALRQSLIS